jgi:membrane-associated protein
MEYLNTLITYLGNYPYIVVFIAFIMMMFLFPIPEEAALFVGGVLSAAKGGSVWIPTLIAGFIGVIISDYWPFILAKIYGQKIINKAFFKKIMSEERQERAVNFVQKYGMWAVFIVRFMPGGFRIPTFLVCGLSNITSKQFLTASILGAAITTHASFWIGYFLSDKLPPIDVVLKKFEGHVLNFALVVVIILLVIFFTRKLIKKYKKAN